MEFVGDAEQVATELRRRNLSAFNSVQSYSMRADSVSGTLVKTDSSVADYASGGGELVTPPLDFDSMSDREKLNDIVRTLRDCSTSTSHKAGVHVHVSLDGVTPYEKAAIAALGVRFEDTLFMGGCSGWQSMRSGWLEYSHPYRIADKRQMLFNNFDFDYIQSLSMNDRYYFLNFATRNSATVEFRLFNSTRNAARIQAYVAAAVGMVKAARIDEVQRSLNRRNAFPLGGFKRGLKDPAASINTFLNVVSASGKAISPADRKNIARVFADGTPQDDPDGRFALPEWLGDEAAPRASRRKVEDLLTYGNDNEHPDEPCDDCSYEPCRCDSYCNDCDSYTCGCND